MSLDEHVSHSTCFQIVAVLYSIPNHYHHHHHHCRNNNFLHACLFAPSSHSLFLALFHALSTRFLITHSRSNVYTFGFVVSCVSCGCFANVLATSKGTRILRRSASRFQICLSSLLFRNSNQLDGLLIVAISVFVIVVGHPNAHRKSNRPLFFSLCLILFASALS